MENEKKWNEDVYLHVCNGGATITIEQSEYGANIKISTGSYGNCNTVTEITTNNKGIKALAELFERASKNDFTTDNCYSLAYITKSEECGFKEFGSDESGSDDSSTEESSQEVTNN